MIHAVMQQRQHHRQQRRLLAAVHGLGRSEHAGRLAREPPLTHSALVPSRKYFSGAAMLPKRVGLPTTRPAHSADRHAWRRAVPRSGTAAAALFGRRGYCRNGAQARLRTRHRLNAAANLARELGRRCLCANKTGPEFRPRVQTPGSLGASATDGAASAALVGESRRQTCRRRALAIVCPCSACSGVDFD